MEIHNVAELVPGKEPGSICWSRVPLNVREVLTDLGQRQACGSTGVEFRFVMKSDIVTLRMKVTGSTGVYHVYRGSIQGYDTDNELPEFVTKEIHDFVIKKSKNTDTLKRIATEFNQPFAPEVVRVILDRGTFELVDVIGDIEPPKSEQLPSKTIMAYGSSITHGSNSLDRSHAWTAILAHNLKMDLRNLGHAGSCMMEPEMAEYIASEGEKGNWDICTLELGINALWMDEEMFTERVRNIVRQVAGRNPEKSVFVISPFYCFDDFNGVSKANDYRKIIEEIVRKASFENVKYINGLDLLGDMSLISADEVHPNIYGVQQIAERLTEIMKFD